MEHFELEDGSGLTINDHFSKIIQREDEPIFRFDLSSKLQLPDKEVDESASKDALKHDFFHDMLDIDKDELEHISDWKDFLLHEPK
jgi:hypothetical protein